jgi:hypothetical protein
LALRKKKRFLANFRLKSWLLLPLWLWVPLLFPACLVLVQLVALLLAELLPVELRPQPDLLPALQVRKWRLQALPELVLPVQLGF